MEKLKNGVGYTILSDGTITDRNFHDDILANDEEITKELTDMGYFKKFVGRMLTPEEIADLDS